MQCPFFSKKETLMFLKTQDNIGIFRWVYIPILVWKSVQLNSMGNGTCYHSQWKYIFISMQVKHFHLPFYVLQKSHVPSLGNKLCLYAVVTEKKLTSSVCIPLGWIYTLHNHVRCWMMILGLLSLQSFASFYLMHDAPDSVSSAKYSSNN